MALNQRERQRLETRQRLFEAALTVFRRDGVMDSRIEDIARLAGVSRPTFYFHFPTKRDVLLQLQGEAEAALEKALVDLDPSATLQDVFQATASAIATRWNDDPKLFVEVGIASLRRAAELASERPQGVRGAMTARFETAAERGELADVVPAQVLADLYLANTFAVALGWAAEPSMPLEQMLQVAAGFFLHGTGPRV